ncbi:MAG TPA: addiction module protein [Blastocatellia bacterium]|jgi:putative addiction module component (TIGR02574 family)|nr:addiction module protein [Blastocatellia bacterium]
MSTQVITDSFRKLPPGEKVRLLQELWDGLADEADLAPVSDTHRQLLDERLQQHEDCPADVEPWDKARDEVLSEL